MYSYGDFMIFAGKSKRSKQNIADVDIRNQISQACLNPNGLVKKLSNVLFKKIKHTSGQYISIFAANPTISLLSGRMVC